MLIKIKNPCDFSQGSKINLPFYRLGLSQRADFSAFALALEVFGEGLGVTVQCGLECFADFGEVGVELITLLFLAPGQVGLVDGCAGFRVEVLAGLDLGDLALEPGHFVDAVLDCRQDVGDVCINKLLDQLLRNLFGNLGLKIFEGNGL